MPGTLPVAIPFAEIHLTPVSSAEDIGFQRISPTTCGRRQRAPRRFEQSATVPPSPHRPPQLVRRVFRGSTAVRSGLLTRHQVHSSAWQRLFPDVYACTELAVTHELRTAAVTRLLLPGAVATGRSAAVLWDVALAEATDDVEVTLPPAARAGAVPGVRVTRRVLSGSETTTRRGTPVTSPIRTALDLGRIHPLDDAVIALDRFLATGLVFAEELRTAAAGATGRDCRRIRHAASLADGLAGSPQETRVRLLLHRSSLPDPVAQFRVRDGRGRHLARVDFAWPEHRLALEYDGTWHGEPGQFRRDRERLDRLTAAGWRVLFVTAADLRNPEALLARIADALGAPRFA
jgi:very-short-patch-repair endonuclease